MDIEFVPLLAIQRQLYAVPRGIERFQRYLATMVDATGEEVELPPLVAMNPMGKDHCGALLDEYLRLDADAVAAAAVGEAAARCAGVPGRFKLGLVLSDDLAGGWTNRWASEFSLCFEAGARRHRNWISGVLWTTEKATVQKVQETARAAVFRAAHVRSRGPARTLREMLAQEGYALAMAGCTAPALDPEALRATQQVLAPHLDSTHYPTLMAALYGDPVAELGHAPLGLAERAGLALALHGARGAMPSR